MQKENQRQPYTITNLAEFKRLIETAIRENFDGMHLNEGCAKPVIDKYGFSRVRWVLANTLMNKREDGRFSQQNRKWLSGRHIPWDDHRFEFIVDSHPAVLDGFINEVRSEWDKKNKPMPPRLPTI